MGGIENRRGLLRMSLIFIEGFNLVFEGSSSLRALQLCVDLAS